MQNTGEGQGRVLEPLRRTIAALEGAAALDRVAAPLERAAAPLRDGRVAQVLRGDWLGHALHPLLTDLPLGCWLSAGVLDLVGGRKGRRSAQRLVGLGLLAVPPTATSGLSDWSTATDRPEVRRVGAVHGIGNAIVALLYLRSWQARRRGAHGAGVLLGMLGGFGAWATGFLGGHLSFARGTGVGERGVAPADDASDGGDALVDAAGAASVIGVPVQQVDAMVQQGMLTPVATADGARFRKSEALAVRELGG